MNYTAKSAFPANLNITLSSLYTNSTRSSGFYSTSSGQGLDRANGLFLCRGDISPDRCQRCIGLTSERILKLCPGQKEAIIWDIDFCMIRYSNSSIFSILAETPKDSLTSTHSAQEPEKFRSALSGLMDDLLRMVVTTKKLFATKEVRATNFVTLYGLVQCTQDISPADCQRCLTGCISEIPVCCDGRSGGRILKPSCNMRYESLPFYQAPSQPPVLPPSPDSGGKPGNTSTTTTSGQSTKTIVAIVIPTVVLVLFFSTICFCYTRKKVKNKYNTTKLDSDRDDISDMQTLQHDLLKVKLATNNFSSENKIGRGGFGDVYKGVLPDGQEIAVKRLSSSSCQGAEEFKNEVMVVAKLQHRNLVRLLGFCLDGEEKILIYEFVPNKSLDYFLFGLFSSNLEVRMSLEHSKNIADANTHFFLSKCRSSKSRTVRLVEETQIIGGITRGLLYLHEDSRLRIIHRDLKASNILLDEEMNPKISDFGMAKIFGVDQTQGDTSRIVGTFGYMSPEYVLQGHFSVKSDVYSFGVLILEIISGRRNSSFHQSGYAENLLRFAWKKWRQGTPLEFMDSTLRESYSSNEVLRFMHIGLLCVQEDPANRPSMKNIDLMLNSFSVSLPLPPEPVFSL